MNYGIIGIICFVGALLGGRWVNERGLRKLDESESAKLVKGLSQFRMFSMIGIVLIVIVYFAAVFRSTEGNETFPVFAGVLIVYMLIGTAYVFYKLKKMQIREEYINAYLLSTAIQYIGIIIYIGLARNW